MTRVGDADDVAFRTRALATTRGVAVGRALAGRGVVTVEAPRRVATVSIALCAALPLTRGIERDRLATRCRASVDSAAVGTNAR